MLLGSTLETMTATVSMRFTLTRLKVSGHCCVHGYGPIGAYRRSASLCIWGSSSLFTTSRSAGKLCSSLSLRSLSHSNPDSIMSLILLGADTLISQVRVFSNQVWGRSVSDGRQPEKCFKHHSLRDSQKKSYNTSCKNTMKRKDAMQPRNSLCSSVVKKPTAELLPVNRVLMSNRLLL
jgi:hypothetical protein